MVDVMSIVFFTGLVERWDMLQARADDLQRVRSLQREMAALRDELLDLSSRVSSMESDLQDRDQLENRIQQVKVSGELTNDCIVVKVTLF